MNRALPPGSEAEELPKMGLFDHLDELRKRLIRIVLALLVGCLVCWFFRDQIYDFLYQPIAPHLDGKKLAVLAVTDPFFLLFKMSALAGTFLVSPYLLYQVWGFVAPGLYRRERHAAIPFIFFGSLLFLGGGAFAYYIAFPFAVEFLLGMGDQFEPVITAGRYFSFLMTVILGLGLMFELPTVITLLARFGLVTPRFLLRHFRWAVLLIFTAAAVVTPTPDVINLCIFALPTLGLYLVGIAAAALVSPRRREAQAEAEPEEQAAG